MRFRIRTPRVRGSWLEKTLLVSIWIVGGGLLVAGVFGASFYLSLRGSLSATEIQVPDLIGQPLEDAEAAVTGGRFVLQVVDRRNDRVVPSGHVLQQTPPPGSTVRKGRKVKIVLSLGGRVLEVPDLVGGAARTVRIDLARLGFAPGNEARAASGAVPTGRIMAQVPPASTPAVPDERIHMLVSTGPRVPTWVMPDFTGLPEEEAANWIALYGFRRGAVRRVSMGDRTSGFVVGQLPLAGHPIRSKDVVELSVAR